MEDLNIETTNGVQPILSETVKKYHLEKGSLSPFNRYKIVDKNGDFPSETDTEKDPRNNGLVTKPEERETENVMMPVSEMIDFAQGTDSSTET